MKNRVSVLDAACIRALLPEEVRAQLRDVVVLDSIDSTNEEANRALERAAQNFSAVHGRVYLAEMQTQGRGRSGCAWVSPHGCNFYGSLIWRFEQGIAQLAGLSLVVGLAVLTALSELGIPGVQLKWPNDVLAGKKKIAGILIETSGDLLGPCCAVIGVGVNVAMSPEQGAAIDQPWVSVKEILGVSLVDRNQVAASVLAHIVRHVQRLTQMGFAEFQPQWNACDAFADQSIAVAWGDQQIEGVAKGVRSDGALRVQVGDELKYFFGGEVSLRAQ